MIKKLRILREESPKILHNFYSIIKSQYVMKCENQAAIFRKLKIDDQNCKLSEYFLYLFFSLYRENATKCVH
jgi:hypothetical protein